MIKESDVIIFNKDTGEEYKGKIFGEEKPNRAAYKKVGYKITTEPFFEINDMGFSKEWKTGETIYMEFNLKEEKDEKTGT